jgi:hypothetical protein
MAGATKLPVTLSSLPSITTIHPSYDAAPVGAHYDPVVPLSTPSVCEGWYLGEVSIPKDTPPGLYRGTITTEKVPAEALSLTLEVWRMQMPDTFALPAYAEYTSWYGLLGHYGKWHEGEELLARQYHQAMIDHRLIPLKSTIAMPEVGADQKGPLLDLDRKPSPTQSFRATTLSNRPPWALFDLPTTAYSKWGAEETRRYFQAVERSVQELGAKGRAFVYLWDEPKEADRPTLISLATTVRTHAPSLLTMVTTEWEPALEPLVDIFVPVMNYFDVEGHPRPDRYTKLRKGGHKVWWYVSCMSHGCEDGTDAGLPDFVIDRPASYIRSIAWLTTRYELDGFLYYSVNNFYQHAPRKDPWRDLWDFTGNGDGTLFYPGRPNVAGGKGHAPIPSLRLKAWREASFDAEYLRWMMTHRAKPGWFEAAFRAVAGSTTSWSKDYSAYRDLRERIGRFLSEGQAAPH